MWPQSKILKPHVLQSSATQILATDGKNLGLLVTVVTSVAGNFQAGAALSKAKGAITTPDRSFGEPITALVILFLAILSLDDIITGIAGMDLNFCVAINTGIRIAAPFGACNYGPAATINAASGKTNTVFLRDIIAIFLKIFFILLDAFGT